MRLRSRAFAASRRFFITFGDGGDVVLLRAFLRALAFLSTSILLLLLLVIVVVSVGMLFSAYDLKLSESVVQYT